MTVRRLLLVFVVILLLLLARPRWVWAEIQRIRSQWDLILRLLVAVILVYLAIGLYRISLQNPAWWPF